MRHLTLLTTAMRTKAADKAKDFASNKAARINGIAELVNEVSE